MEDGSWLNDGRFYLLPRDKWCDSTIPPVLAYAQRHGYWHVETGGPVPGPAEILNRAGLDWRVLRTPVYATLPGNLPGLGGIPATFYRALVREDTEQVLAVVGRDYSPIQNSTAATAVVDLAQGAWLTWRSEEPQAERPRLVAAAPYGRERAQALYVLDLGITHRRDTTLYLLAHNGHGHGGAMTVNLIATDDVGTVMPLDFPGIAFVERHERHVGNPTDRLTTYGSPAVAGLFADRLRDVLKYWSAVSQRPVTDADKTALVEQLWPGDEKAHPRPGGTAQHPRNHLLNVLSQADTLGAAYGTVCRYLDRVSEAREKGDATKDRWERLAAGAGHRHKERALSWLVRRTTGPAASVRASAG